MGTRTLTKGVGNRLTVLMGSKILETLVLGYLYLCHEENLSPLYLFHLRENH